MNENQKISSKVERRATRKENLNKGLKNLLYSVKQAKRRKKIDKIKELEIKIVKLKYTNNPNKLEYETKE